MAESRTDLPVLNAAHLAPYISLQIVKCNGGDRARALPVIKSRLMGLASKARGNHSRSVVADGVDIVTLEEGNPPDEVEAFSYVHRRPASWWHGPEDDDTAPPEQSTELIVLIRRGDYVAISGTEFRRQIEAWIRKDLAPFRLLPEWVLQQAFLAGRTKGLWLEGVHHRSSVKPDTKTTTGIDLRDTLSQQDSTYALNAGLGELADSPDRVALTGSAGTTPRKSVVWNKQAGSFTAFLQACVEVLDLIVETEETGRDEAVFGQLAESVDDLSGVRGAYEVIVPVAGLLLDPSTAEDQQLVTLASSITSVTGSDSPNCTVGLGLNGNEAGRARINVQEYDGRIKLDVRTESTSDPSTFPDLRDHLDDLGTLRIYYESGHVINGDRIYQPRIDAVPFRGWQFRTIEPFDIGREKPATNEPEIHALCGTDSDDSLFGWVTKAFSSGVLICDDGSGEMADFLHIDEERVLSLIHVKAAHSRSDRRGISASAYELVAGQATKNLLYLDHQRLLTRIDSTLTTARAAWADGERCSGRQSFRDALLKRRPSDPSQVVIVQPHVRESVYTAALNSFPPTPDLLRLKLLDTILNTAASSIAENGGARLLVVGSN